MTCPDAEQWEDYLQQRMTPEQRQGLEEHLRECAICQDYLGQVRANEVLLDEVKHLGLNKSVPGPLLSDNPVTDIQQAQSLLGDRYRVLRHINSTPHSDVFQAVDTVLERQVAIKFLGGGSGEETRAWQEARLMGRLNHSAIAQLHEIGQIQDHRFIVLEWVDGLPLTEAWKGLHLAQRLRLFLDVLEAVGFAHRHHVIHQDLKPSNILVTSALKPKILDFGIAVDTICAPHQAEAIFRGTPAYCAPEQINQVHAIGPATDVFALGVLLYELLTDTHPFPATDAQILFDVIQYDHPPLPTALAENTAIALQNICLKALEKDPQQRYADGTALAHDLQRHLRGEKVWARPSFLADQVQQELFHHRQTLQIWRESDLLTQREYDRLEQIYERLVRPADPSIIESRKLSVSQVCLYLGGWVVVLGCVVLFYKTWAHIPWWWRPAPALGATVLMGLIGAGLWHLRESRLAIGFLATANLLIPLTLCLTLGHWDLLTVTQCPWGEESVYQLLEQNESTVRLGNTQLFLTGVCWLTVSLAWLRWTRSSIFMLFTVLAGLGLWTVILLISGLTDWSLATSAGRYLIAAVSLIACGIGFDRTNRVRYAWAPATIGLGLLIGSLTAIALSEHTYMGWIGQDIQWLSGAEQRILGLFFNGLLYLGLAGLYRRVNHPLHRNLAQACNWLGPIHLLAPLRILDLDDLDLEASHRLVYRILLPLMSLGCVASSVTRQMKSFFFSGLGGIAASIHKITTVHLSNLFAWPVSLILAGIASMLISWWVPRWQARQRLGMGKK
jgi:hypothetical protein